MFLFWFVGILTFAQPTFAGSTTEDLLYAGRVSEAWTMAKAAAQANPDDVVAQELYIDLAVHMGMQLVVETAYRERVKKNNRDPMAHYCLGRSARTLSVAMASYQMAVSINPNHARAHMGMGAIYRNQGKLAEADGAYRKALLLDPSLAEAWSGLQVVLASGGMKEEALKAARLAVENVGHRAEPHLTLARLQPSKSLQILEAGAKRASRDPQIHVVLSQEYALSGQGSKAIRAANTALQINPNHTIARRWRGFGVELDQRRLNLAGLRRLLDLQGDVAGKGDDLEARAQKLAADFSKSALVHLVWAQILTQAGKMDGAITAMERAAKLDPRNDDVHAVLGLAYLKQGALKKAQPVLDRASADRPADVSLGLAAATAHWKLGEKDKAIARLIAMRKVSSHDVRVVLTLAGWLNELDRTPDAYDLLKTAAKQNPDVRIALAVAGAARDLGRQKEAVAILDDLARETGSKKIAEMAEQLRNEAQE